MSPMGLPRNEKQSRKCSTANETRLVAASASLNIKQFTFSYYHFVCVLYVQQHEAARHALVHKRPANIREYRRNGRLSY